MSKQPEALRLADLLDQDRPAHAHEAAAELRRLHDLLGKANALNRIRSERIAALEQAGRQALEALGLVVWTNNPPVNAAIAALRERLAEPTGKQSLQVEQPEPVAWISKHGVVYPLDAKDEVHPINDLQPLYTAPQRREWVGLTGEEIGLLTTGDGWSHLETPALALFARAIEAELKERNQ